MNISEFRSSRPDSGRRLSWSWARRARAGRRTAQSQSLDQWLAQLNDPDAAKRRLAVVALGSFGPDLTKAMIEQIGETAEGQRSGVFAMRPRYRSAISARRPKWRCRISKPRSKIQSPLVRRAAVFALGNLGTAARSAVPELAGALSDDNETVRHAAAYALGSVGEEAKAAADALGKVLVGDADPDVRQAAAFALGEIGSDAA